MSKLITFCVIYLIVGIIINLFAISLVKNSRDDDDDPTDLKK